MHDSKARNHKEIYFVSASLGSKYKVGVRAISQATIEAFADRMKGFTFPGEITWGDLDPLMIGDRNDFLALKENMDRRDYPRIVPSCK